MVTIIIYRAGDGTMSVMPAAEYDGDADTIVGEIDPFARAGWGFGPAQSVWRHDPNQSSADYSSQRFEVTSAGWRRKNDYYSRSLAGAFAGRWEVIMHDHFPTIAGRARCWVGRRRRSLTRSAYR